MEKPLELSWVDPQVGWGGVSGKYQSQGTVLARLMEYQIWCLPAGSVRGGVSNGTMVSASNSLWEKTSPPAPVLKPNNSVCLHMSLAPLELQPQC